MSQENESTSAEQPTSTEPQQNDNELRGALFTNDKGNNPNRPDSRGRCTINGQEYRISGWKRTAKSSGKKFISLSFTPVESTPDDLGV